jgi:hypothetical protein
METESSSVQLAVDPYDKPDESSPHLPTLFPQVDIISRHQQTDTKRLQKRSHP